MTAMAVRSRVHLPAGGVVKGTGIFSFRDWEGETSPEDSSSWFGSCSSALAGLCSYHPRVGRTSWTARGGGVSFSTVPVVQILIGAF